MNYVFCGAYKALLFALYLKNSGKKISIITYNKNIIDYCISKKINYIQFKNVKLTVASIYKIFAFKKMLDNVIKKIDIKKDDRFFLMGNAKGYDFFYLAKELSKKGTGYYKLPDGSLKKYKPPKFKPIFFRGGIIRFAIWLVLGLNLMYYRTDIRSPIFGIDNSFLKKHNIVEYAPEIDVEEMILDGVKKNKSHYKKYDSLIIDQGAIIHIINAVSIEKMYGYIFQLPMDFAFKKHPNPTQQENPYAEVFYELFKHCEEIPRYIPVELFCNNIKKNVLSLYSTALITVSQFKHLKSISLLELVDWYDNSYKNEWKDRLIKASDNKILFPNSFDELKEILIGG